MQQAAAAAAPRFRKHISSIEGGSTRSWRHASGPMRARRSRCQVVTSSQAFHASTVNSTSLLAISPSSHASTRVINSVRTGSPNSLTYGKRVVDIGGTRRTHTRGSHVPVGAAGAGAGGGLLADMAAYMYAMQMQQEEEAKKAAGLTTNGASVIIRDLLFHPPGVEAPLLNNVSMDVTPNSLGLIIGRSGSGKTTLLQVLSGLTQQTSGVVTVTSPRATARGQRPAAPPPTSTAAGSGQGQTVRVTGSTLEERMDRVGLVFQFPERHFLGRDVFSELTFTWPRNPAFFMQQQQLRARVAQVLKSVQLEDIDVSLPPWALSGGQQRRLALAIQLVRQPSLLLLDEPLAGLDWQARREVVDLLHQLKKECTLLVVSHDIREIYPLVDCAWTMKLGGTLTPVSWPPEGGLDALTSWDARDS